MAGNGHYGQGRSLSLAKQEQIRRLAAEGCSQTYIHKITGVAVETVRKYGGREEIATPLWQDRPYLCDGCGCWVHYRPCVICAARKAHCGPRPEPVVRARCHKDDRNSYCPTQAEIAEVTAKLVGEHYWGNPIPPEYFD